MKKINFVKAFALLFALLVSLTVFVSCGASNKMDADLMPPMDVGEGNMSGSNIPSAEEKGEMADSVVDGEKQEYEPKIIKTATVYAETKNFNQAVAEIEGMIAELGGYSEKSDVRHSSVYEDGVRSRGSATYVIRIPAENLDQFLSEAGELLHVTSSSTAATDVSGQYYDIESRIKVLEGERTILEKMLEESKSVGEMIDIENRLYDVIYEIESYKTALKVYDGKVAYSTVYLYLSDVEDLTSVVEESFGTRFVDAVSESWNNFVEFCQDVLIFSVYAAPVVAVMSVVVIVIAVIALIVTKIIVSIVKKKKSRKAQ